ncbi:ATP-binding protein [Paenarthrobacter sp. AT5]|uniref:AlbA family DNA-binding domain-containing protein n=1 Tax=Paenarthrobacter TaxID=1742992 RepID=UPI001A995FDC|nr:MULTISPECIES: ATP-binding protein [Paenarthrobacter]QSZ52761.1 hypothetical protein AYX19_06945 [Paenarthrobacter ureafaciens]WOC60446.1 ATP-binding protein [Paenarthrobacter sp. AT5]
MSETAPEPADPARALTFDGQVSEEKLAELLALGAEHSSLDFKKELNLNEPLKKLDFIKDCAAMMNQPQGGYLVIGANDDGTPAPGYLTPTKEMFDSAALTEIVRPYVDAPIDIRAQVHTLQLAGELARMAVIYIAPPADGIPAVMAKDGITKAPSGTNVTRFSRGVVFTREGTSNAVVTHKTWGNVLANFRSQERAESRQDVDALIRRTLQMVGTSDAPPMVVPDLGMDSATFTDAVSMTLTDGNVRALRKFFATAKNAYHQGEGEEQRTIALNRIAAVAAEAVIVGDIAAVKLVMDVLSNVYESYLLTPGRTAGKQGAAAEWLEIILRVMAVGAAAVRNGLYGALPTIVLRPIGDSVYSYRSWIRHGLTEASRANLLVRSDETDKGGNLIAMSAALLRHTPDLRPDMQLADDGESGEDFLDSLCQFDFLWCCLSLASNEDASSSAAYYPSCAAYHQYRITPALHLLENKPEVRAEVFGDIPDQKIADSILEVIEMAKGQSWNYGGWWGGRREMDPAGWTMKNATIEDSANRF